MDIQAVLEGFRKAKSNDGSIILEHYLEAFSELIRFFDLMGTLFSFISSDLREKSAILKVHRESAVYGKSYQNVKSMIEYEVSHQLTKVKNALKLPSGSRTLLRLHRALEFINLFLLRLRDSHDSEGTAKMASEIYETTLAKYHVWLVRKAAAVAIYTLPSRGILIDKMLKQEPERVVELLTMTTDAVQEVYNIVQELYASNDLLNLP